MQKLMFVSIFITTRSLMMQCDRMWSDAPPITAWQLTLTHTHHQGSPWTCPQLPVWSIKHQCQRGDEEVANTTTSKQEVVKLLQEPRA